MPDEPAPIIEDGSLRINARLRVPLSEVLIRFTTSGGPGGQHANRTLSRVVATFYVEESTTLTPRQREILLARLGRSVSASSSSSRSQTRNRTLALELLAQRISDGLKEDTPRRSTRPTRASVERRVSDKKRRGRTKALRQRRDDD